MEQRSLPKTELTINLLCFIFLMLMAGLMSGLTLGLLSIDKIRLEILAKDNCIDKKRYMSKMYRILKHQHLLLVTLLIANAVCVESMPIFLDKISNSFTAIIISVFGVLFFGDLLYLCIFLFFPIAYPLAKIMDCLIGDHLHLYNRGQLKVLLDLHSSPSNIIEVPSYGSISAEEKSTLQEEKFNKATTEESITFNEIYFMKLALDLGKIDILSIMKPISECTIMTYSSHVDLVLLKSMVKNKIRQILIIDSIQETSLQQNPNFSSIFIVEEAWLSMVDSILENSSNIGKWNVSIQQFRNSHPEYFLQIQFIDSASRFFDAFKKFSIYPNLDVICVTQPQSFYYGIEIMSSNIIGLVYRDDLFGAF